MPTVSSVSVRGEWQVRQTALPSIVDFSELQSTSLFPSLWSTSLVSSIRSSSSPWISGETTFLYCLVRVLAESIRNSVLHFGQSLDGFDDDDIASVLRMSRSSSISGLLS